MKKYASTRLVLGMSLSILALLSCTTSQKDTAHYSHANRSPALQEPNWGKTEFFPKWAYDPGPLLESPMGKELNKISTSIPCFPCISDLLLGEQMFRPAYGAIPWRMLQKPNSVKILFIGQDGTHIAEAAGRPATAGFGGRAQDMAKYFGVGPSAAFINAYAFTIKGQDGSNGVPVVMNRNGAPTVQLNRVIDNQTWLLSRDLESPLVQWRNDLIEWIIRNNRDSLKMIVTFGKPAQDAAAAFVLSRLKKFPEDNKGTRVGSKFTAEEIAELKIKVPEFKVVSLGSNYEGPVLLGNKDQDLYKEVLGGKGFDFKYTQQSLPKVQNDFSKKFRENPASVQSKMVFANKGLHGSGVLDPAQIGGYDLDKMYIAGEQEPTISIKGLKISNDMGRVAQDLIVIDFPHPTYLSGVQREFEMAMKDYEKQIAANPELADPSNPGHIQKPDRSASTIVAEAVAVLDKYKARGWKIEPDYALDEDTKELMQNSYHKGDPYTYGRADMGPEFYDFGAPASRMVNVSSATRLDKNVIVFGGRDASSFEEEDRNKDCAICDTIDTMKKAQPEKFPSDQEMWTNRPRTPQLSEIYDPGPPKDYAIAMKDIPKQLIDTHPVNRDYGHYRGTFKKPKVVILADQDGWDDLITSRALTGTRGQFLHGFMKDLRVDDQYLVIKTAPFSPEEKAWPTIFQSTMNYRVQLFQKILSESKPKLILTDGEWAKKDISRILSGMNDVPQVVSIERSGKGNDSGIQTAAKEIKDLGLFGDFEVVKPHMADIPRSHLTYYARLWEGTSGDRVVTAPDEEATKAFAEVAPYWATQQNFKAGNEGPGLAKLIDIVAKNCLRKGNEKVAEYLVRKQTECQ